MAGSPPQPSKVDVRLRSLPLPPSCFGPDSFFEEKIVFNQLLGLKVTSVALNRWWRASTCGQSWWATMPTTASMAAISAGKTPWAGGCDGRHWRQAHGEPPEQRLHRFAKLGTIDLPSTTCAPGIGSHFELRAEVLR